MPRPKETSQVVKNIRHVVKDHLDHWTICEINRPMVQMSDNVIRRLFYEDIHQLCKQYFKRGYENGYTTGRDNMKKKMLTKKKVKK